MDPKIINNTSNPKSTMLGAMTFSINDTQHNAILHRAMLGTGTLTVAL
jgi:hypothetical protein